ncbi:MAG: AAA family ATPase [Geothrix sp.]|uniref:AAA family ATPase n=1 Tax=Geothrix sp. TaxID=1962974 RepID=UPI0017A1BA68|nr:AAA family ATPase [Geothrix sp.]NWJ42486.1 AAA family ATPase [Geothrix sp.]WIL19551.1 MAG: AAA family ATPase [Geothrix sp.]
MITKLSLENWKSFEKGELHFDPMTVLIGTNASGKSNALDALMFLYRSVSGTNLTSSIRGEQNLPAVRGGLDWAARSPGNKFRIGVTVEPFQQDQLEIISEYTYTIECVINANRCEVNSESIIRKKYKVSKNGTRKFIQNAEVGLLRTDLCAIGSPTITARLYNGKSGTVRFMTRSSSLLFQLNNTELALDISEGVSLLVSDFKKIFILDPIPSHMRDYRKLSDELEPDANNVAGVLAAFPPKEKAEIEAQITEFTRALPEKDIKHVFAEAVGKYNSDAMLYCEEGWNADSKNQIVDARGMSDGTLRFIAIVTALLTRPIQSLLVIEEVDNGLHPSRAKILINMLKKLSAKRHIDLLITTHNATLLDEMGPEMLAFIAIAHRDSITGNSHISLLDDIEPLAKLLASNSVGKLSSRGVIENALSKLNGSQA